jgi:soluble lytic murein transglycosylase-like protein
MTNWKYQGDGPKWIPVLNATEDKYAIPTDLLARVAYQESRFRPDIISGATCSAAGCVGIMQLNPEYYPNAGKDPKADIDQAGQLLESLHQRFSDWQVALAAYNWGGGNVHHQWVSDGSKYVLTDLPQETQNYVTQICADVPVPGSLIT